MQSPPGRRAALALLVAGLAFGTSPAAAHAIILSAMPAVDAVVRGPDLSVQLRFNSRIDKLRSRLTLIGPDAKSRSLAISSDEPPDIVAAKIGGLAQGSYRLRWQVLATDGHITRGDIPFTISR
jgi:copper resistance protein C